MDNLTHKQKTLSGLKWNFINQFIQQFITLAIGIIMARLLTPKAFGLLGMIAVFTGFLQVFKDFGLGSALVHKSKISPLEISTVFWINMLVGIAFCLILIGSSGFISAFYNNSDLSLLVSVSSVNFIIQALNYVQSTLLKKDLGFKKLFGVYFLAGLISGLVAIWMAYNGYGVWSLIVQTILSNTFNTIILWSISSWRPSFQFSWNEMKSLMRFSLPLLGTQTFQYWNRNTDNLLVGKFLGESDLGAYTRAYSLMLFPVRRISSMLSSVMFPSISLIQNDIARIGDIYIKSVRVLSTITIPLMGLLFLVADQFVITILGIQWLKAIPVIRILCGVGAMQSISTLNGNIFLGLGRTRLQLKLNLILGVFIIASISVGILWGIQGVAYGYLCATLVTGFVLRYYISLLINRNFLELIKPIVPSLVLSIIAVILLLFLKDILINNKSSLLYLFYTSVTYIILIFILFSIFSKKELKFVIRMVNQLLKS